MDVNAFVGLAANTGFPIVICAYLLIRLEKQILDLTGSITKLNTIISTKLGVVIDTSDENKIA